MDINTTFGHWLTIATTAGYKMQKQTRPNYVGGKETPETLNNLTIGQLIELSELGDGNESIYRITDILLQLTREQTDNARAVDVVRLVGWTFAEVERINKIFAKAAPKPTDRERRAGVEKLNFGLFGMLDWYAKRMGITNHDEVLQVPWARIYKCMDMDSKTAAYEKRLQDLATEEMNRKRR